MSQSPASQGDEDEREGGEETAEVGSPKDSVTLAHRLPDTHAFFMHHAMRVKRRMEQAAMRPRDDDAEWSQRWECEVSWRMMDRRMERLWASMRLEWLRGDTALLRAKATAYLFKGGCAIHASWWPRDTSDPLADDDLFGSDDGELPPLTRSLYYPETIAYRSLPKPKRTVFVRVPPGTPDHLRKAFRIADACRVASGSVQESVCEDAQMWGRDVCVVRFRKSAVDRRMTQKHIKLGEREMQLWPYPHHHPQIFVAEIEFYEVHGIRLDSVQANVAVCLPHAPFHILHYTDEKAMRTFFVLMFARPQKLLGFSVGVQMKVGQSMHAIFNPAVRLRKCPICREDHRVEKCRMLQSLGFFDLPRWARTHSWLPDPPKIL